MKQNSSPIIAILLGLLLLSSCAPPWHGEEGNYPIVALAFEDTLTHTRLHWADLGITGLENVEHQRSLPIGNAFAQPGMNFDSRLNEDEWLLLPIDKADTIQTFVLHHTNGTDTIRFEFKPSFGVDVEGNWDQYSEFLYAAYHTFPAIGGYEDDSPRRYYHPQIMNWLWVAL
jgi:hypothetical protein